MNSEPARPELAAKAEEYICYGLLKLIIGAISILTKPFEAVYGGTYDTERVTLNF